MGAWEGRSHFGSRQSSGELEGIQGGARVASSACPVTRGALRTFACPATRGASVVENQCIMDTMFTRIAVRDVLTLASVTLIVSVCVWWLFHDLNGLEDA